MKNVNNTSNVLDEIEESYKKITRATLSKNEINKKITCTLQKYEKTFTAKSEPVLVDENRNEITLKQIHELECFDSKPVTMIAVTRNQYNADNFSKYVNYIKNNLKITLFYIESKPKVCLVY